MQESWHSTHGGPVPMEVSVTRFSCEDGGMIDGYSNQLPDVDPQETQEWLDSLDAVVDRSGPRRAQFLLSKLVDRAQQLELDTPMAVNTPYINTIPAIAQPW